jgi:hypothetical protein
MAPFFAGDDTYQDGKRVFWDVHHPEKTIVIDLHDERYNELVVEVGAPSQTPLRLPSASWQRPTVSGR